MKSDNNNYTLLVIGDPYSRHLAHFVRVIKKENPQALIDVFGWKEENKEISADFISNVRYFFLADRPKINSRFKVSSVIAHIFYLKKAFRKHTRGKQYDIINIHYPTFVHTFLMKQMREVSYNIVLTPWGSDVYRIPTWQRFIIQRLYDNSDYVTGNGNRFTKDFMRIYNIPSSKLQYVSLGSSVIDYVSENKNNQTTEEAKAKFGINGSYVITCGYNASPSQQHLPIVEAIDSIRDQLPEKLVLLFPFTYGGNSEYKDSVKKRTGDISVKSLFFEEYLDYPHLLDLRQATDMFIHVQSTDANSGSLKEYLLLEKNVINGSWLLYDDLETDSYKPYYTVDRIENLGSVILNAYRGGIVEIRQNVISSIEELGVKYQTPKWNDMFLTISNRKV